MPDLRRFLSAFDWTEYQVILAPELHGLPNLIKGIVGDTIWKFAFVEGTVRKSRDTLRDGRIIYASDHSDYPALAAKFITTFEEVIDGKLKLSSRVSGLFCDETQFDNRYHAAADWAEADLIDRIS